jgi:CRISPR-associated endonuclease Cas3-HD
LQDLAEWSGLLHDFGKYSDCFQKTIREGKGKCQHAIHGAAIAYDNPSQGLLGLGAPHIAHAIAGHHAGIPDRSVGLQEKVKTFLNDARSLRERAMADSTDLARLLHGPPPNCKTSPIASTSLSAYYSVASSMPTG